jgi:hypothetical protein
MDKATRSVLRALTPRQCNEVLIDARRRAIIAAKAKLKDQGLKPAYMSKREIVALAEVILAERREELVCASLERFAQTAKP